LLCIKYSEGLSFSKFSIGIVPGFMKGIPPDVLVQEWPTFKKYELGETTILAKYKQLIGLAVAAAIKCPYCQLFHREAAKMNGATDEELAELAYLAKDTAGWSAAIHAQHINYETYEKEFNRIKEYLKAKMAEK
jgi:AhpD family alkylhydroperoxidase